MTNNKKGKVGKIHYANNNQKLVHETTLIAGKHYCNKCYWIAIKNTS
jgi:hypothetical protein